MGLDWQAIVPERFRINYEQKTGIWRVLDTWHPQIMQIADLATEIPDSSPAIKVFSDLEINALIAKLDEMGWLDKIVQKKLIKTQKLPEPVTAIVVTPQVDVVTSTTGSSGTSSIKDVVVTYPVQKPPRTYKKRVTKHEPIMTLDND